MTLRHFTILREAAGTGSFTKAAENLFITQSAVSHAVREMEEETRTCLFDRLAGRVQLTRQGELLLAEVLPVLASVEALDSRIRDLEARAPIHIVSCITIAGFWLPELLKRFRQACPDTPVRVEVVRASAALQILEQGKSDLALVEGSVPPGRFEGKAFASYPLYVMAAPGYTRKRLTLPELLREELLLREQGSAIRDTFEGAVKLAGYEARPSWTSVNSRALIEAAKAGLGITVLPGVLAQRELAEGSLSIIKVGGLSLENSLTALMRRDKYAGKALRVLWDMIGQAGS